MTDTAFGYLLLGIGIVFVLVVVFALTSHLGSQQQAARPPRGVHMPSPSSLPVSMAIGTTLFGAGLAFRADDQPIANLYLAVPGLILMVIGIVRWVRAAGREWHETERTSHDDATGH